MITNNNPELSQTDRSIWEKLHWTWAHTFVVTQLFLQILLLLPGIGAFRAFIRVAAFGIGLLFLISLPKTKNKQHPATPAAIVVLTIMLLQFCLHPYMNSVTAGMAQGVMYLAILSPLFWVRAIQITPLAFESLMFLMWGISTLSSILGLLQVYYPGQFQLGLSVVIQNSRFGGEDLLINLADGTQVYRPMGLTDVPGGAANSGLYALLFGVVIALKHKNPIVKILGLAGGGIGLFCIYLTHIRSVLILAAISMVVLAVVLLRIGQIARATAMITSVTGLFMGSFFWAIAIGGQSTLERISSLFTKSPQEIYQQNRGSFLQDTIDRLLPQYPLGAGLGRWGMINNYFGENFDLVSQPIWVEIQWTGWLLDGGIPLIFAYIFTIYIACITAWKISINRQLGDFALWGGLIFAYDIGVIALTFNYPIFMSQGGMEFWLLNAALFIAAESSLTQKSSVV